MAKATVSLAGRDILDLESFSVEEIQKSTVPSGQIYHQPVLRAQYPDPYFF